MRNTSNTRLVVAAEPAAALVVFAMDHCCGFVGRIAAAAAAVGGEVGTQERQRTGARPALASASAATRRLEGGIGDALWGWRRMRFYGSCLWDEVGRGDESLRECRPLFIHPWAGICLHTFG